MVAQLVYERREFKPPVWAENIADVGGRVPNWHKSLSSRCALNKRDDFVGLKSDTVNVNSRLAPLRRVFTEICESWFNRLVLKTSDHKRSIRSNRIVSANIYHNQVWRKPSSICWVCFYEVLSTNPTLRKFTQCWQRGRFAKSLGLRKKASRIDTCNFRQ